MSINLADEVEKVLQEYGHGVKNIVDEKAEEVAEETVKTIKNTAPKKTGKYSRSWKVNTDIVGLSKTQIVHSPKHYRRAHLLEYGHATPSGGRTRAYPHLAQAEEKAKKDYEQKVRAEIEKL